MSGSVDLPNPVTRYSKPPFGGSPQPVAWPCQQNEPAADHGEKSYKGPGGLPDERRDHGRRFRHGRAAAIAYARRGGSLVAIIYFPTESPTQGSYRTHQSRRPSRSRSGVILREAFCRKLSMTR